MSPYQKEIIDTTMQEYDVQAGRGRQHYLERMLMGQLELLVEQDKGLKWVHINQSLTEIELHY